ncbi:ribosomal protein L7/L12 [Clostridium gasigenes]
MDVELKNLIREGKKIKAIKKYRIVTGLGLKEAKDYVDSLSEKI